MSYKIVYFTRTGISRRVAEKISKKLSCETVEITDNMNWKGIMGFLKGGAYSSKGKEVEITLKGVIDSADEIIVVTPLWASKPAPAVMRFLKNRPLGTIRLVATSKGSTLRPGITGFKSVTSIVRRNNDEDSQIEALINSLK